MHSARYISGGHLLTGKEMRGANQIWNETVDRGGFEKKRVNPPIGAIKDRWIGGFGGKGKVSEVNYRLRHQSWLIGR
jgi:hypothetical protein